MRTTNENGGVNWGFRSVVGTLAFCLALLAGAAPAQAGLTVQEQGQANGLAAQIVILINAMPSNSTQGQFTSVMLGATAGASCAVVASTMGAVAATPNLPAGAVAAANQIAGSCINQNIGALPPPPGPGGPGFSPGGGGSNYQ